MEEESPSFGYSDLQSNHSDYNDEINFDELMITKNERDTQFMKDCDEINQEIYKTKEEMQSLMILTSAFCANVGTKTESVILPSVSPRHCRNIDSIDGLEQSTNVNKSQITPKSSPKKASRNSNLE